MNRIENKFRELKEKGEKALILYLTAGDPDLETTEQLILALDRAGWTSWKSAFPCWWRNERCEQWPPGAGIFPTGESAGNRR